MGIIYIIPMFLANIGGCPPPCHKGKLSWILSCLGRYVHSNAKDGFEMSLQYLILTM